MTYITATYCRVMLGTTTVNALTDTTTGVLTQLIAAADAVVVGAVQHAGYVAPSTTTGTPNPDVRLASFGQWVAMAYARKGIDIPAQWKQAVELADRMRNGTHAPNGLVPNAQNAVGGSQFSDTATTSSTTYAPVLTRWNMRF